MSRENRANVPTPHPTKVSLSEECQWNVESKRPKNGIENTPQWTLLAVKKKEERKERKKGARCYLFSSGENNKRKSKQTAELEKSNMYYRMCVLAMKPEGKKE